jgi:hypothetical protein
VSDKNLRNRMGKAHEAHLCEVFGYRQVKGSGSQWNDQMDARGDSREEAVAFVFDGKSTRAASMSITREMLDKAREQCSAERPSIAVRFYDDDRLKGYDDWDLIQENDLLELLDRSSRLSEIEDAIRALADGTHFQEVFPDETAYEEDGGEIHAIVSGLSKLTVR